MAGVISKMRELVSITPEESARYSRHLILPEIGIAGQERLKASSILCIGAGGLGSPILLYLGAAGVGRIGIVDADCVDVTNLQRQIVHGTSAINELKTDSARQRLHDINPFVTVETYPARLTSENALAVLSEYDLVIDGSDNFPTRYLVNDACVLLGKPLVYGAIYRFEGQASVFGAANGPCYRCLFPKPPEPGEAPSCAEAGVLGVLPGIIGCIQANEALKLLLQIGEPLVGRLLLFDALAMRFRDLTIRKRSDCPVCGESPTIRELIDYEEFCNAGAKLNTTMQTTIPEITPRELKAKQDRGDQFTLIDVREPAEYAIARIPGATLIPMGSLPSHLNNLDPDDEIILQCRSGVRSAQALVFLQQQGFTNVKNLRGGILAWSDDVDPTVTKY
jgi:sulfur-carrier protein adenylyltransferase/sulfurtransferase